MGNPMVRPANVLGFVVVVLTSFLAEVAITTGCLTLFGMSAGAVFAALIIVNFGTYAVFIFPDIGMPLL